MWCEAVARSLTTVPNACSKHLGNRQGSAAAAGHPEAMSDHALGRLFSCIAPPPPPGSPPPLPPQLSKKPTREYLLSRKRNSQKAAAAAENNGHVVDPVAPPAAAASIPPSSAAYREASILPDIPVATPTAQTAAEPPAKLADIFQEIADGGPPASIPPKVPAISFAPIAPWTTAPASADTATDSSAPDASVGAAPAPADAPAPSDAPAELAGPWLLPATGYRTRFEQGPPPVIYGPLTFGCGNCVVTTYDGIRYPVMHLTTNDPPVPICDNDVLDLTDFLTYGMHTTGAGKDEEFVFLHDLRFLWPKPSRVQMGALIKFVGNNKKRMDNQLKAIAIVVGNPIVRKLINFFIWMFRPMQPVRLMADLDEGFAFLRESCPTDEAAAAAAAKKEASANGGAEAGGPMSQSGREDEPRRESVA